MRSTLLRMGPPLTGGGIIFGQRVQVRSRATCRLRARWVECGSGIERFLGAAKEGCSRGLRPRRSGMRTFLGSAKDQRVCHDGPLVKTPDPASDASRIALTRPEPGPYRSDEREDADFRPKYLSLPMRRTFGQGRRNLTWGVVLLVLSGLLFGWALYLAGPGAAYPVAGSLATGVALYVIARSRLLRQRNGTFLAGAMVCLLAVCLVLVQQA